MLFNCLYSGLIAYFLTPASVTASNQYTFDKCCPTDENNLLAKGHCSNNDNITFNCQQYVKVDKVLLSELQTSLDFNSNDTKICEGTVENSTEEIYLLCYDSYLQDNSFEDNRRKVVTILTGVSVLFLILTLIIYGSIKKLRDLQGICMIHAILGLTCDYIFLGILQVEHLQQYACASLAIITYFSLMYMFFWLSTLSFHIWRTVVLSPSVDFKWWLSYHIFAISGSMICLLFVLTANYSSWPIFDLIKPNIGITKCWFETIRETTIYLYVPMGILLLFNIIFYCHTVYVLFKVNENMKTKRVKYKLKLCISLSVIMGLSWIFEIITAFMHNDKNPVYIKLIIFFLDSFNMLQGFLIFLVLVVFRRRVRRLIASAKFLNLNYPDSWKYLTDAEIETVEENVNETLITYRNKDNNNI